MKTAVVIPNWNGAAWIADCLDSLQAQTQPTEIIVVENGSTDNSADLIKKKFPKVTLLQQPKNLGFAGGVNVGIAYALERGADYVALFNNDAVAEPDWLERLVKTAKDRPKAGIFTGKLRRADNIHLDSTGECYTRRGMSFPRGRNHKDTGQYDQAEAIFAATGGATLYRAAMLRQIGLFDERFFAYFEDVDISLRARLAGWDIRYEPTAVARHRVGETASRLGSFTRYHFIKNFHMTYVKNMPGWLFWKYLPLFIFQSLRLGITSTLRGALGTYLRAWGRFILNLPYILQERHRIQKARQVTPSAIDELLYRGRPPRTPAL